MQAAAFSTGVSIQWPQGGAKAKIRSVHRVGPSNYPFALSASSETSSEHQQTTENESYSACQELAYHFACEKTRTAVQTVLLRNNNSCYVQVLRFFDRFCGRATPSETPSPFQLKHRGPNAPVSFPGFHAFPTAAVIAGADATASELWVDPLKLTLQCVFPLCLAIPRDVPNARRLLEWLAGRLARLIGAQEHEEQWLKDQIDGFDLLPLDQPPVVIESSSKRRMTRKQTRKKLIVLDMTQLLHVGDEQDASDSSTPSDSGDDSSGGKTMQRRAKRRVQRVLYTRWTMTRLLTTIQRDVDALLSSTSGETCHEYLAMLGELVTDQLQNALVEVKQTQTSEEDMVVRSLACFDEAVAWLQRRLVMARDVAASLRNVATPSRPNAPLTMHVSSTELAFARLLQRVLAQCMEFLESCSLEQQDVTDRTKVMALSLSQHENFYCLNQPPASASAASKTLPFLLLCIEQLEAFPQQVLSDFLAIWTHFVRQQERSTSCSLGLVLGVASAASPALRRLDLGITSRLELQFFSLVDSRKCFDDILESLVVNANFPLALSGNVLRHVASRHRRLPSVPRLLLALRLLLFAHLRSCPWSFLALAVAGSSSSGDSHVSPIPAAAKVARLSPTHRVSLWLKRHRRELSSKDLERSTSASTSGFWLAPFNSSQLQDLIERLKPSETSEDWTQALDDALLSTRHRRERWRLGWMCFRAACSWLNVTFHDEDSSEPEDEEQTMMPLALALDGQLSASPCFAELMRRLQRTSTRDHWKLLANVVEDWRASFRLLAVTEEEGEDLDAMLTELRLLCEYAATEKPPSKMLMALKQELTTVFTDRLLAPLLHPAVATSATSAEAVVAQWVVLSGAEVLEERLRFEYHDQLRELLSDAGMDDGDGEMNLWLRDVGLAFLFYQESASVRLGLREWYDTFADELQRQESDGKQQSKKRKREVQTTRKARFVRALCTLRHWGFLKSDAPKDADQEAVEKLVFI
ncbi:hypothetical protein BBJ28_00012890 [Nothophytophthora sp. Chile5]|nr:hypothetical protein BBJ28_00012890 [Nothophytophthora sp. Chile5]